MELVSRNGLRAFACVMCFVASCRIAFAVDCSSPTVLFAFQGSFETWGPGKAPTKIVDGFRAPRGFAWAPGCAKYGFIDSGSLWVGALGQQPKKAASAGEVLEFQWSPDGQAISATVERTACSGQPASPTRRHHGDAFLTSTADLCLKQLTEDCGTYVVGWSDDSKMLLLSKEPGSGCDPSSADCPGWDLVTLDPSTKAQTRLIDGQILTHVGYAEPQLIKWNVRQGQVYIWTVVLEIGGDGAVAAIQIPSGRVLWTHEAWSAKAISDDNRIVARTRKVEDYDKIGRNWSHQYAVLEAGRVVAEYPAIPSQLPESAGSLSNDGKYIVWFDQDSTHKTGRLAFETHKDPKAWEFDLPPGMVITDSVWTPSNQLVVQAYEHTKADQVELGLWWIDPQTQTGKLFFRGSSAMGSETDVDSLVRGAVVSLPGGELKRFNPPLVIAGWSN